MIYFEDIAAIDTGIKHVVVERYRIFNSTNEYWRLCTFNDSNLLWKTICNADTLEELQVWADLHELKITEIIDNWK